ncbi:glycosyltransferase like family 2-domain-containing protein [Thelonectria olida]|uniref:Glycosyltransferase like family 2-domain-containing protein n=1 Tax=Thelonectria olida TaxID=1576542 RepID=A0A9P8VYT1_9HYPO|nr:glycosyltransferase like family 2-domain-containing protein [Thelonectria olida]
MVDTLSTEPDVWIKIFWIIFALRYVRLLGHLIGCWMYRPSKIPYRPAYFRQDVTVIVPTVDPSNRDFNECINSILINRPAELFVVTVGDKLRRECMQVLEPLTTCALETRISVSAVSKPSKRRQVAHAMPQVKTHITILADDHVFWLSKDFLTSVLAPFENVHVGIVATPKRVVRTTPGKHGWSSIVNFIACNYLQRHNWELRASNAIDGGVFVVSGRTAAYRTQFLADEELLARYSNEKFFMGLLGGDQGLGPDDDNFLTREAMKKNWLIRFQDTEEATIMTTLGEWPKFKGQLTRWARTTIRSNPVMLRDAPFVVRYCWSAFMVYWVGLVNFALLWDAALIASLVKARGTSNMASKMVKIIPHFMRHPRDMGLVFYQIAFAYVHSFIKLWALLTFWDCDWSGRNLDEVNRDGQDELDTSFFPVTYLSRAIGQVQLCS